MLTRRVFYSVFLQGVWRCLIQNMSCEGTPFLFPHSAVAAFFKVGAERQMGNRKMELKRDIALLLLVWMPFPVCAATWTSLDGVKLEYEVSDNSATVTDCTLPSGFRGELEIPSTIEEHPVCRIGGEAFFYCSGLTSVKIPNGVTDIGRGAFSYCSGLMSFAVASDNPAYMSLNGLLLSKDGRTLVCGVNGHVVIPLGVSSVENDAFWGCASLLSLTIPESLTSIDLYRDCSGLTAFHVSDANPNYMSRNGLLLSKDGKTLIMGVNGHVSIPDGVTNIGSSAFYHCGGSTSVTIPNSVTNIEPRAFYRCLGLSSVTIPPGVSIGEMAFFRCPGLASVTIPPGASIGGSAFGDCGGLTLVTISEGVVSIGANAFCDCSGLTSVTIPNSVTNIGWGAFSSCIGLTSVTIPSSVTSIEDTAFSYCSGLKSIGIPEGVTNIGWRAFSHCSGLTSVTIPSSVTSIGEQAFVGCGFIREVVLCCAPMRTMRELFPDSYYGRVTNVVLGVKNVAALPKEFFEGCRMLQNVELSAGLTAEVVEAMIPDGIDPSKVTFAVAPTVKTVRPNGAKVKIVRDGLDITGFLNIPVAVDGIVAVGDAAVKAEIAREPLDAEKGAVVDLGNPSEPTLKTAPTKPGLVYTLREGATLNAMADGDSTVGDGQPWTPAVTVKGGANGFYTIRVSK